MVKVGAFRTIASITNANTTAKARKLVTRFSAATRRYSCMDRSLTLIWQGRKDKDSTYYPWRWMLVTDYYYYNQIRDS